MTRIELRSDNSAGVVPEILSAVAEANSATALAYGGDDITDQFQERVREVFEHPRARIFPVTSGTAANALGLSAICPPWGAVLCHRTAHILTNECGSTSLLGGGAVMIPVEGDDFQIDPDDLLSVLAVQTVGDPHHSQPSVLSFTQPTDLGTVYPLDRLSKLSTVAKEHNMRVHLDGARFANAVNSLGCSPADMTWKAGVDVFTLGATKNGALSSEAIVSFDDRASEELHYRTKRSGHVTSKMRFQSAQLLAYLDNDLWLRTAGHSNSQMAVLAAGLREHGVEFVNRPDVNMAFLKIADDEADALEAAGIDFYRISPGVIRFVTSWMTTDKEVARVLELVRANCPR